jgi:hypothetical protein
MAIATYTDLRTALGNWLSRGDLADRIPEFITMAEATMNKVVRSRLMVVTSNYNISSGANSVSVNDDILQSTRVVRATNATETLQQKPLGYIDQALRVRQSVSATPLYYAIDGNKLIVAPVADTAKVYAVSAYRKVPPLASNSTNWLLTNHPDIYLYYSLWHAYPYLKDEERSTQMWQDAKAMADELMSAHKNATLEGMPFDKFEG